MEHTEVQLWRRHWRHVFFPLRPTDSSSVVLGSESFPIRPLCFSVSIPLPVLRFFFFFTEFQAGTTRTRAACLVPHFTSISATFVSFVFVLLDTAGPRAVMRIPSPEFEWHGGGWWVMAIASPGLFSKSI
ncbi:hypothetical protein B0I37DRAFT_145945 [Chaetomium sp. MPI-CAGE-AT-0009]|nr:hypothetical protein B0I37DRAFT_145945 [Chaetomium sp. MPI-CAGE-AT-0009]